MTLITCLNQSILQLYQNTKNYSKRFRLDYSFSHYHNISISKYDPLAGSSYIKLRKELDHPKKGLINIEKIDDNEYFINDR